MRDHSYIHWPRIPDIVSMTNLIQHRILSTVISDVTPPCRHHRHLSSQLTEMERVIDKMVSADFVRHVTSDLNRPLDQQLSAEEVSGGDLTCDLSYLIHPDLTGPALIWAVCCSNRISRPSWG